MNFVSILNAKRKLVQNILDSMPAAARTVFDEANAVFRAATESGEPQTKAVPATATIETSAGVNRPQEQPKDIVNEMVAAMRRVRGLDR
jgi:hypothetical protein